MEIESNEKSKYYRKIQKYLELLGINEEILKGMDNNKVKSKIDEWDSELWRTDMMSKHTLRRYRMVKQEIGEEKWFRNEWKFTVMMRARSDTLRLGWREFGTEQAQTCSLCNNGVETLEHFIMDCPALESTRTTCKKLQRPREEDRDKIINAILLLDKEDRCIEEYTDVIKELWMRRASILKQIADTN